jgi:hypothetical protein
MNIRTILAATLGFVVAFALVVGINTAEAAAPSNVALLVAFVPPGLMEQRTSFRPVPASSVNACVRVAVRP